MNWSPDEYEQSTSRLQRLVRVPFGKHRGKSLDDIDPGYLEWMLRKGEQAEDYTPLFVFVQEHGDDIRAAIRASHVRVAEAFVVDYELNDSQQAAVDTIDERLLSQAGDCGVHRLDGGAGYGKSFVTMELVRRAKLQGYQVEACATSYVASMVLDRQLGRIGVRGRTIASLLRMMKVEDEDREEYTPSEDTSDALHRLLSRGRMLIVDECYMVNDEIARMMLDAAHHGGGKLLLVGDAKQLPPVKQSTPSIFLQVPDVVELTEPMRFSRESDLYQLEQLARENPHGVTNGGWLDSDEVTAHESTVDLLDRYVEDLRETPDLDARALFFRRRDVADANAYIRMRLHGADIAALEPVVEDERLMVMATSDVLPTGADPAEVDATRYYSGQSFLVEKVERTWVEGIPCYSITFSGRAPVPVIINVPGSLGHDEHAERLRELREECRATGQWQPFRNIKRRFLQVGYSYAMTVHRCQGQTVDRCYFAPALLRGPMQAPLTYVAATRAKRAVHMVIPE